MKYLFALLLLWTGLQAGPWNHDAYDTQPKSIIRDSEAYRSSFFGSNDLIRYGTTNFWSVPLWVSYEIKAAPVKPSIYPRPSQWTTDKTLVLLGIATTEKPYLNSHYDRGHMCMKEIGSRMGADADLHTHSMLNAVPQTHELNAGIWLDLEKHTMQWADRYGSVWVICGPAFSNQRPTRWIGDARSGRIAVPDLCWKIIIRTNAGLSVLAFQYPNVTTMPKAGPYRHEPYAVSLATIEKETGLTFLKGQPVDHGKTIETLWP